MYYASIHRWMICVCGITDHWPLWLAIVLRYGMASYGTLCALHSMLSGHTSTDLRRQLHLQSSFKMENRSPTEYLHKGNKWTAMDCCRYVHIQTHIHIYIYCIHMYICMHAYVCVVLIDINKSKRIRRKNLVDEK